MRAEIRLKGSPKDLALKIDDLGLRRQQIYGELDFWFIPGRLGWEVQQDENPIYISIKTKETQMFAEARRLPDNCTLLVLETDDEKWNLIEKSWRILQTELENEGWIVPKRDLTETQPTSTELSSSSISVLEKPEPFSEVLTIEEAKKILENIPAMKKIYKDFSLKTALRILDILSDSWNESNRGEDEPWGPRIIADTYSRKTNGKEYVLHSTTIGRYLKAFIQAGIKAIKVQVEGEEEEIIPIPHRFK